MTGNHNKTVWGIYIHLILISNIKMMQYLGSTALCPGSPVVPQIIQEGFCGWVSVLFRILNGYGFAVFFHLYLNGQLDAAIADAQG